VDWVVVLVETPGQAISLADVDPPLRIPDDVNPKHRMKRMAPHAQLISECFFLFDYS
jgi:hypothetical protein